MNSPLIHPSRIAFAIATAFALQLHGLVAQTYDLSTDFSLSSNPASPWSYGAKETLLAPFTLFPNRQTSFAQNGVQLEYWVLTWYTEPNNMINKPGITAISDGGQGAVPPGGVLLYPGIYNSYLFGVARFTVPQTGTYLLQTSAHSYLNGSLSGDSELHVLDNGTELFGQFIAANSSASYSDALNLIAGHTIDFAIGRGADGDANYCGPVIQATLTLIPEPSVCSLIGLGAVALLRLRRRSRSTAASTG